MLLSRVAVGWGAVLLASLATACGGSGSGPGTSPEGGGTSGDGATSDGATSDGAMSLDGAASDAGLESAASDAASTDGGFETAAHAPQPQVVNLGGERLTAPKVQLIVYTEDPTAPAADSMITELTQTSTWREQTSQYGIGPLTKLPTLQIAGTPPSTLDDNAAGTGDSPFQDALLTNTSGANPVWGAADPDTIYTFLLPLGTSVESDGSCCTDFLGYHFEVQASASVTLPYAVVCDCPPVTGVPLTSLEFVTTTISHELVESATDPRPNSDPAYVQTDSDDLVWTIVTGGEIADMCQYNADSNYTPPGSTYMIQRVWSNSAALAGTNPCVPVPTTSPFFDSMPVLTDSFSLDGLTTDGVIIPVGSSKTFDVRLFSSAPTTGPWKVTAYDMNEYLGQTPNTTVSLDKDTGSNGDVLHLTIQVNSAATTTGGEGFVLQSDLGGQENLTMGAVGN
jgi:hypothetical protein